MKTLIAYLAVSLSGLGIYAAEPVRQAKEKPNIIFIFADDMGYGDLGIHGSTFCKTPHLDRMAAEGVDFQSFTVNGPVCSPSRAAVITGQFPARQCIHQHFFENNWGRGMPDWLDPKGPSLLSMMQEAGYVTGHFGKWHLGDKPGRPSKEAYGCDSYATFIGPAKLGDAPEHQQVVKNASEVVITAETFIRENKDHPFYLNLWLHETHLSHFAKKKYLEQFKHLNIQQQVYAAVTAEADDGVGRILELLKELNLDENTLVLFSSDNGPQEPKGKKPSEKAIAAMAKEGKYKGWFSCGETGGLKGGKRSLFAGGVRAPFIVRWPGAVPAGKVDRASVLTAVDLLPTFVELAGGELRAGYKPDGESIASALRGEQFNRTKPIFWEWRGPDKGGSTYTWPNLAIRDGKWKLLVNKKVKKFELYDLGNDWAEQTDVAAQHPEVVKSLGKKLDIWKASLPTKPREHCLSKKK